MLVAWLTSNVLLLGQSLPYPVFFLSKATIGFDRTLLAKNQELNGITVEEDNT